MMRRRISCDMWHAVVQKLQTATRLLFMTVKVVVGRRGNYRALDASMREGNLRRPFNGDGCIVCAGRLLLV